MDWEHWQRTWDAQQAVFLPDREERIAAMLDVVEAVAGEEPRVLDLAAGTGSISRRLLARLPAASSTVLDVDPALLTIARATFEGDDRVQVVRADLADPAWTDVAGGPYDAVLTATALHWLPGRRVRAIYAEVRQLLRSGGVLVNADQLDDPGLPGLSEQVADLERRRREAALAADPALGWEEWWAAARRDPDLAPAVAERDARFGGDHADSEIQPAPWHVDALREAGYREAGLVWRGRRDAAVAGVR